MKSVSDKELLDKIRSYKGKKINAKMLAEECYYSNKTMHNRLHELERQGLIERYYTIVIKEVE